MQQEAFSFDVNRLKADVLAAYEILSQGHASFAQAHRLVVARYEDSLAKITQDKDNLMAAMTLAQIQESFLQFQGKSKMTLGLLRCLGADVDQEEVSRLLTHQVYS